MRKNRKTKHKDKLFFERVDIFNNDLIVYCAEKPENIHKVLNQKRNKWASDFLKDNDITEFEVDDDKAGGVIYDKETLFAPILIIKNTKRDWEFFETLLHEVTHYVDLNLQRIDAMKEIEFRAYLTEYLFRRIRSKLH